MLNIGKLAHGGAEYHLTAVAPTVPLRKPRRPV